MTHRYYSDKNLDDLGKKQTTDKSSLGHNYLRAYEFFLSKFRKNEFSLMELGVGWRDNKGASLRMWAEYFNNARIIGVDIDKKCKSEEAERISVEIGDSSDPSFLLKLQAKYSPLVIVDDASHLWSHQITAFEALFPLLLEGGVYICEDIQTSFVTKPNIKSPWEDSCLDAYSYFSNLSYLVSSAGCELKVGAGRQVTAFQQNIYKSISSIVFIKHSILITK